MGNSNQSKSLRLFFNNPHKYIKNNPKSKLKYALIVSSWIFQGQLYADKTEKLFKIFFDILLLMLFYFILINFTTAIISILIAFILAHTINWVFNTNFLNLFTEKFGLPIKGVIITYREDYVIDLQKRIRNQDCIQSAAIYGSISRNETSKTSDLDIRIIRKPGIINGFRACMYALIERSRATFNKFPLDLFLLDSTKPLSKLRLDEMPVVLHDPNGTLRKIYPQVKYYK